MSDDLLLALLTFAIVVPFILGVMTSMMSYDSKKKKKDGTDPTKNQRL